LFVMNFYPFALLSLRFFPSWGILAVFLIISSILELVFNHPIFLVVNNITILLNLVTLFLHYPEKEETIETTNILSISNSQIINTNEIV